MDHIETLKSLPKSNEFFIGIDSDGCVFDTMEIKHKECFIPNIINSWGLQAVSRFARDAAEFVNLYSQQRGCNRFIALVSMFDLLADWDQPIRRGFVRPDISSLEQWIAEETRLGNPALEAKVAETSDAILTKTLAWSKAVNATVDDMVHGCPPYPFVRESLEKIAPLADLLVVSSTPEEALTKEWNEHDVANYVMRICGQEAGSKKEHLGYGACGKYDNDKILMIGDAPGDMKAAKANGVLYFPIIPSYEEDSWQRFHDEAADRFFAGTYAGEYEQSLIDEFMQHLPATPPWKN